MQKKLKILLIIMFSCYVFLSIGRFTSANEYPITRDLKDDVLIATLSPAIYSSITGHYGKTRLFDSEKILSIEQDDPGSNVYTVQVQVTSFEGAHNPPYGLETVTLRVSFPGITVVDFKHKVVDINPIPHKG
ncbi:DUF3888 domain-containing protein [Hazenella sp. IB182353]|uniref:DUF3888 domain-containing protein n=1 Tax=Polycladospora coralii TaxID=2771432 RepID=UPI001745F788|nr:DUF3888 domain-containing protein [Polycladospora coralii]